MKTILNRIAALFRRRKIDAEMTEEMQLHLEHRTRENIAAGMASDDARYAAQRKFGGVEQAKEHCREQRWGVWLKQGLSDLRLGVRGLLRRDRGFALVAGLLVAVGIGANTAIFSVAHSVIWRPLPYLEPERLVALWTNAPRLNNARYPVGAADHRDWREQNTVFTDIALARDIANFNLTGVGEPERLSAALISANLLSVLGVQPQLGRGFVAGEDQSGRERVVLLGHAFWQRRFGGDPAIVGRDLLLNGTPYAVVGVLPADFAYPVGSFDIWVPLTVNPADYRTRSAAMHLAVARLKPGVTLARARAEMEGISQRLARAFPATNEDMHVTIEPLHLELVRTTRLPLLVLLGAVGCLLLIAAANLANLFFARALVRRRELQVKVALGASRGRIVRQMIAEMLPLLALASALGWILADVGVKALTSRLPAGFPRLNEIGLHWPAAVFATAWLGLVILVAILWPALSASRGDLFANLRSASDLAAGGTRRARLRDALLVAEVGLTALLVTGAILLARTFVALESVDLGFRGEGALSLRLAVPRTKYRTDAAVAEFTGRLLERVRALPGVHAAGTINRLPLGGVTEIWGVNVERTSGEVSRLATANLCIISPDYFPAMGIPQLRGRGFGETDSAEAPRVAIVDERIAQRFWPGENAVGKRVQLDVAGVGWIEIVGVVGHIRMEAVDLDPRPQIYLPYRQWPRDRVALVVRTAGARTQLASSVIAALREVDSEQPVYEVQELRDVVAGSLTQRRVTTVLVGGFAIASLGLAVVGVYGVFAFMVSQRTREFGVRLALGAQRGDLSRLVLRRAIALTGTGLGLGLLGTLVAGRFLRGLLFATSPADPLSFGAAVLLLLVAAVVACWLPARRAARVDPVVALRAE